MYGWVVRNITRATTFVVKQRRGERREIRWTPHALPVLRHRRAGAPPSTFRRLLWLCLPGLAVLLMGFATFQARYGPNFVGLACAAAGLALAVNAWMARAHWSLRVLGVVCSLSFPLFVLVHALA